MYFMSRLHGHGMYHVVQAQEFHECSCFSLLASMDSLMMIESSNSGLISPCGT